MRCRANRISRSVQQKLPAGIVRQLRHAEFDWLLRRVQRNIECRAAADGAEGVGQKPALVKIPVSLGHFARLRRQPQHAERAVGFLAADPVTLRQLRETLAQRGEPTDEVGHVVVRLAESGPVDPADLVILTVGVVVAGLAVADLVAGKQERDALRQHQAGQLVLSQLPPQRDDRGVVGRAFVAAVGAQIVVGAIAIVLAIGFVVLGVIRVQVGQGEAVMNGDVVDARTWRPAVVIEDVCGAGHPAAHVADQVAVAAPVAAQGLAIPVVPFRPLRRKAADLIAASANVPRLGDQLDGCEYRVLPDCVEERTVPIVAVWPARECRGKVETKAVDLEHFHPIAQRIHHHLENTGIGEVQRISTAGEVVVVAPASRGEPVVGCVVDTAKREGGTKMVALGGVIVDDVKQHLEAGVMQPRDRGAKFSQCAVLRVARLRREIRDRVVSPVVRQLALDQLPIVDKSMHRQEFDRGDAEALVVIDHGRCGERPVAALQRGRNVRVRLRQAFDMGLIDDRLFPRDARTRLSAAR